LIAVNVHRTARHSTDIAFDRPPPIRPDGDLPMLDVLMVTIALAFFALSVGYVYACDRL
jgi:hypothetical protein